MAKTVADQFAETLAAGGVKRIYGIVGDSLNGLTDAIRRQGKIEWIHVRHEEVAARSGANRRRQKASRVVASRLQAWSTAFHTAGATRPWTPRRASPNCPLRMRCISSMPAIVIAAVAKPLKPSIVAIRCFTPRWSCSIRLFKYFDDRSFVSAGS